MSVSRSDDVAHHGDDAAYHEEVPYEDDTAHHVASAGARRRADRCRVSRYRTSECWASRYRTSRRRSAQCMLAAATVLVTALVALGVFGANATVAAQTISADVPLPSVLGLTYQEVHELWGEPRYIKVAPHDGDTRYAYFTLREWQRLASLSPATQGEDVYVHPALNVQVHLRYRAVHDAANRFTPEYRVAAVTYVFPEPTPLSRVAELLQRGGEQGGERSHLAEGDWYIHGGGLGRTALVHWPDTDHPAADLLTPFRADPPVTLYWELGLSVPATALDQATAVNYVIERLDQFLYSSDELQAVSSPLHRARE